LAKYLEQLLRAREEAADGRLSIEELLKQGF
jgi:hypothetical protein